MKRFLVSLALVFISCTGAETNKPLDTSVPNALLGKRVTDIDGLRWQLGMENDVRPVVLIFLDENCSTTSEIAPFLNDIFEGAEAINVAMYTVVSNPDLSWQAAVDLRDKYDLKMPVLHDSSGDLALRVKPNVITEAILVNQYDDTVYRGNADNNLWSAMQATAQYEEPDVNEVTTNLMKLGTAQQSLKWICQIVLSRGDSMHLNGAQLLV